jgi:Tfp pilus assembly major pilin PilA
MPITIKIKSYQRYLRAKMIMTFLAKIIPGLSATEEVEDGATREKKTP